MEPYWYVRQLGELDDALQVFDWYKRQQYPSFLFRNTFMGDWLVAAYTTDEEHLRASRTAKTGLQVDGYTGEERLLECFAYHDLLESANVGSMGEKDGA